MCQLLKRIKIKGRSRVRNIKKPNDFFRPKSPTVEPTPELDGIHWWDVESVPAKGHFPIHDEVDVSDDSEFQDLATSDNVFISSEKLMDSFDPLPLSDDIEGEISRCESFSKTPSQMFPQRQESIENDENYFVGCSQCPKYPRIGGFDCPTPNNSSVKTCAKDTRYQPRTIEEMVARPLLFSMLKYVEQARS